MWLLSIVLVLAGSASYGLGNRLSFPGCDRAGWKCFKQTNSKYNIEYTCPPAQTFVEILLWNFNIVTDVQKLRIQNCSNVRLSMQCTSAGRQLIELRLSNIGTLNFTVNSYKEQTQSFETMIFENISMIETMPEKTFKQMKPILASTYGCTNLLTQLNTIIFRNVTIDNIDQNTFWNLSNIKEFIWDNVKVNRIENSAININMDTESLFSITRSNINTLEYKAFDIKASKIHLESNNFGEMFCNSIRATTYDFNFVNNTVESLHANSMSLLAQNVSILNNSFQYVHSKALEGIGPGLLQDSQKSFGKLMFAYKFKYNEIMMMEVGSLNPDWTAYKNVRSIAEVKSNKLICTCPNTGWITIRNGLGSDLQDMMIFNEFFLDRDNNNMCSNAPCLLPAEAIRALSINNNLCNLKISITELCKLYNADKAVFSKLDSVNANGNMAFYEKPGYVPVYVKHNQTTEQFPVLDIITTSKRLNTYTDNPIQQILDISQRNDQFKLPFPSNFKIVGSNLLTGDNETEIQSLVERPNPKVNPNFQYSLERTTDSNDSSTEFPMIDTNSKVNDINSTILSFYSADEQKNILKKAYENWQNIRRKKLVLFKIYGSYLTLE